MGPGAKIVDTVTVDGDGTHMGRKYAPVAAARAGRSARKHVNEIVGDPRRRGQRIVWPDVLLGLGLAAAFASAFSSPMLIGVGLVAVQVWLMTHESIDVDGARALLRRTWRVANVVAVPFIGLWLAQHLVPQAVSIDDMAYWGTRDGVLYELTWNAAPQSYIYSPAFAQVFGLVNWLPYPVFHVGLSVVQLAAVLWLLGPALTLAFCLTPFLGGSYIWNGNITPLLAVCLVRGFYAPLVLTKILPGVTLLWFVGRRDWGGLAKALWVLIAIVAASFVLWPGAWFDWADALARAQSAPLKGWMIPLAVRLPVAAIVALYAGHTNRRWLVPVAAMLSVGDIWWTALVWLTAVPRLLRDEGVVLVGVRAALARIRWSVDRIILRHEADRNAGRP